MSTAKRLPDHRDPMSARTATNIRARTTWCRRISDRAACRARRFLSG